MSAPDFGFLANDNLPPHDTIVASWQAPGYDRSGIPLCNQPSGPIIAWVKYGPNVTMAEALTQDYVARFLIANSAAGVRVPRVYAAFSRDSSYCVIGYIVMQYIDAPDCGRETISWLQGLCRRLVASKVRAPRLGPSAEVALYTTFSWSGRHQ
jgi:hypothetical protein